MHFNPLVWPTLVCAIALYWCGYRAQRLAKGTLCRASVVIGGILLALPGFLYVAYFSHLFDNAAWFYNLRAIRFSELAGAGVGFLAGYIVAWFEPETTWQRVVSLTASLLVVSVPFIKPLLVPLDCLALQERCADGICMQSTLSTCGPASAATFLTSRKWIASEKELATECYTYRGGTESWYLVRAFRRRGFDAKVEMHEDCHFQVRQSRGLATGRSRSLCCCAG